MNSNERPRLPFAEGWPDDLPGEGWWPILVSLDADLRGIYPEYRVAQVKEKFGGLRFYPEIDPPHGRDDFWARIRQAEDEADRTCEVCGEPGTARSGGWIKTLCDEHAGRVGELR